MVNRIALSFFNRLSRISTLLKPTFLRPGEMYSRTDLKADIIAGVTVAIIQIPQSMALALIAGLPAVYGLYASLPGFIASLWGSSRQLSTGPVAIISFLTLTSLVPLAEPGSPQFIQLAATLALLVGLIYFLIGVLRLGIILHLVPHSVIVGFSSAVAAIIVITQIPTLFGIPTIQHDLVLQNMVDIIFGISAISLPTLSIGLIGISALIMSRRLPRTFPSALVILVAAIVAGYFFNLGEHGVALVKHVPQSLPFFQAPWIELSSFLSLIPKAAIIALVGFVSAHASAKVAARKTREHLETNQELVGQGLANIATGFFQGFPISGSFTRTALNVEAGARTPISSVVTSIMTVIALLFLTPFFYYLPRTILAAIVIVAAIPLIDFGRLREMYNVSNTDGFVAYLTFTMAFILKPSDAVFIGIVTALVLFIRQTAWVARVVEVGVDRELQTLRASIDEANVDTFPGVVIARIGMSVYYANASSIVEDTDEVIAQHVLRTSAPVKTIVIDVSGVNFIDVTGLEVLEEYFENLKERGIRVCLIYVRKSLRASLSRVPDFPAFTEFQNIAAMRHALWLAHK